MNTTALLELHWFNGDITTATEVWFDRTDVCWRVSGSKKTFRASRMCFVLITAKVDN